MASPYIQYGPLVALATIGGYNESPKLSQLSGSFLLSACLVMRQKWLWQNPIDPISQSEYENILEMIEQTEGDLMTSSAIGSIVPSVADLSLDDSYLLLDGALVDGTLFPQLLAEVPASWVIGTDIQLPDMQNRGLFGESGVVGDIVGENDVQLTVGQLPSHNHTQNPHSHTYSITSSIPTVGGIELTPADQTFESLTLTGASMATNNPTGNDETHNNIPESLTVYWYIKAK